MKKRVAIVGAGISGLVATKCCLDEGLDPVCFEQHDAVGGIWNYSEAPRANQGAASFWSLITNSSKETMAFSDFPMPEDYPQYMHHSQYLNYMKAYAEHFDLVKHIQFNTTVLNISKTDDYVTTGRWEVQTKQDEKSERNIYDAVIICSGASNSPRIPDIEGMHSEYKGELFHMHSYRTNSQFKNKTVLVVGNQNSAADAAADISHVAKQVYWSVGNGTTVMSRFSAKHIPNDVLVSRFIMETIVRYVPGGSRFLARLLRGGKAEAFINHRQYGLSTKETLDPLHGGPLIVNDELKYKIMCNRVKCKGNLVRLSGTEAHFSDETFVDGIDVVMFATGYNLDLPFVDDDEIKGLGRNRTKWPMYKWVFPIHLSQPTLAVIALIPLGGPVAGLIELQSRWVAAVMSGNRKLPSAEEMRKFQAKEQQSYEQRTGGIFQPLSILILKDLADELDACPSFWKLFMKSPSMALKTQFGPVVPALYRINGHGSFPNGAENYRKICNRIFNTPDYQREPKSKEDKNTYTSMFIRFMIVVIVTLGVLLKLCAY